MTTIVHRVPQGSGTLTANCGASLGRDGTGQYGPIGHLPAGWSNCEAGCWPSHRRNIDPGQDGDQLARLRAELTGYRGGKRRAEVSA